MRNEADLFVPSEPAPMLDGAEVPAFALAGAILAALFLVAWAILSA